MNNLKKSFFLLPPPKEKIMANKEEKLLAHIFTQEVNFFTQNYLLVIQRMKFVLHILASQFSFYEEKH